MNQSACIMKTLLHSVQKAADGIEAMTTGESPPSWLKDRAFASYLEVKVR